MLNFSEQFELGFFLKMLPKDSKQQNTGADYNFLPADDHSFYLHPVCSRNQGMCAKRNLLRGGVMHVS